MSMLPVPGERPGLPSLPVLGASWRRRAIRIRIAESAARPPGRRLPEWLKRPIPAAGGMSFTRSLVERAGPRNRLRECAVPQPLGVLDPPHGDVHDPGRRLHPALRLLRGQARAARAGRPRRARTPGRSLPAAGAAPRRHHLGHARRPAGRRRRALPPVRPGRAPANRRHDRGAHARLRRSRPS